MGIRSVVRRDACLTTSTTSKQIVEKHYIARIRRKRFRNYSVYGIAFCGKFNC